MKLKDLFKKNASTAKSEKVVIKVDKKQLAKITGGDEEFYRVKVKFPTINDQSA